MGNKLIKRCSQTISIKWIDQQMAYLSAHLGLYKPGTGQEFFFEPTGGFYGFIAQGRIDALNEAMKMLSDHITSRTAPIIEDWEDSVEYLSTINHDFSSGDEVPGLIKYVGPNHSRIKLGFTNKHSPFILGAILAHELTHHFLFNRGIVYDDIDENERLTDLATVYLGLGKLTLNGYEPVIWHVKRKDGEITYTYKVGYLTSKDMAMIFERVCSFRHISKEYAETNLTPRATELLIEVYSGAVARHKRFLDYVKKKFRWLCRGRYSDEEIYNKNKLKSFVEEQKKIISCSNCGQKLSIPIRNCDLQVKCPNCNEKFIVSLQR